MDPYSDSDPAFAATPLESPTPIPTFRNCPKVRFQPSGGQRGVPQRGGPPFQIGGHPQGPLRYDPNHGFQHQGHAPPNSFQQQQYSSSARPPVPPNQQLMRPMIPPIEFLDQHLDVFQASSYDLQEDCFVIESGPPEKTDLDLFCVKGIVDGLVENKRKLRAVPQEMFGRSRQRCNPYELVGSSIFMNRASVKLASIDSQLALTATKEYPEGVSGDGEASTIFRFADLCSGPGGFSEYLLWRKHTWGERAKGWAMTLKNDLDFQLEKFHKDALVEEALKVYYGADGTGDILNQANIDAFAAMVEQDTEGQGVSLVSADGGISVDGDEAVQETILQRLILCQILTMFLTLQKGGDFVVKIFDIFTPVTAGLVWILSRHFEKICVVKPLTSRPMNSERYVVCRHLLQRKPIRVIDHLQKVNAKYQELADKAKAHQETMSEKHEVSAEKSALDTTAAPTLSILASPSTRPSAPKPATLKLAPVAAIGTGLKDEDINHLVNPKAIAEDAHFMEYIKRNNMKTAIRQTEALDVFLKYANEGLRPAFDQEAIKRLCLQEWHIPPRPVPVHQHQHQHQHQHPIPQQQQPHPQHPYPHHHSQQRPPHQQHHHQPPHGYGGHGPQSRHPQHPPQPHPYPQQHPPGRHHPYNQAPPPQHHQPGLRRPSGGKGTPGLLDSILNNMQPPPGAPR